MTDSNETIPTATLTRVLVDNPYEVRRWCQRLICTESQLRAAVASAGPDPDDVRAALKKADRRTYKSA